MDGRKWKTQNLAHITLSKFDLFFQLFGVFFKKCRHIGPSKILVDFWENMLCVNSTVEKVQP